VSRSEPSAGSLDEMGAAAARAVRRVCVTRGDIAAVVGVGPLASALHAAIGHLGVTCHVLPQVTSDSDLSRVSVLLDASGDPVTIDTLLERAPRYCRIALVAPVYGQLVDVDLYRTVHSKGLEVIGVADGHSGNL